MTIDTSKPGAGRMAALMDCREPSNRPKTAIPAYAVPSMPQREIVPSIPSLRAEAAEVAVVAQGAAAYALASRQGAKWTLTEQDGTPVAVGGVELLEGGVLRPWAVATPEGRAKHRLLRVGREATSE